MHFRLVSLSFHDSQAAAPAAEYSKSAIAEREWKAREKDKRVNEEREREQPNQAACCGIGLVDGSRDGDGEKYS